MRMPWPAAVGGVAVVVLGAAGLVRGAVPQSAPAAAPEAPIVVSNAYVRAPAPPGDNAAAYFTIRNTTDQPDQLLSATTGAGESAVLHTSGMTVGGAATVPAQGRLVLSTGRGHVMIQKVYGTLRPGQTVNLALQFARAGEVPVTAKVVAFDAPAPTGGS